MAKDPDSKEKTVLAAAKLLSQQGYHGTALNDIVGAAGSPRGSLYFHFPRGKEEIGEAALALVAERVGRMFTEAAEVAQSAEDFVVRLVRSMAAALEHSDFKDGCPIAVTALETGVQSEALFVATRNAFRKWESEIKRGLQRFGMKAAVADFLASTVLSQIEGALLLARTYRDLEPLRRAERAVKLLVGAKRFK